MAFFVGNQPQLVGNATQRLCQLIGTRGASTTAVDTFEASDGLVYLHTANECRNTLRIAVATAYKLYRTHLAVLDDHVNQLRTNALRDISSAFLHLHFIFWEDKNSQISRTTAIRQPENEKYFNEFAECKKLCIFATAYEHRIELWCNGNTSDFGSEILGSSPDSSTQQTPHCKVWRLLLLAPSTYLYRLNTRAVREVLYILMVWRTEPSSHFSGELKW